MGISSSTVYEAFLSLSLSLSLALYIYIYMGMFHILENNRYVFLHIL